MKKKNNNSTFRRLKIPNFSKFPTLSQEPKGKRAENKFKERTNTTKISFDIVERVGKVLPNQHHAGWRHPTSTQ